MRSEALIIAVESLDHGLVGHRVSKSFVARDRSTATANCRKTPRTTNPKTPTSTADPRSIPANAAQPPAATLMKKICTPLAQQSAPHNRGSRRIANNRPARVVPKAGLSKESDWYWP